MDRETPDDRRLKKRLSELAERADSWGCAAFSEFLTVAEQDILSRLTLDAPYELVGGYAGAERRLAAFAAEGCPAPALWLRAEPASMKFADALTHRDFLGALMGLGVRREVLGDIIIHENIGYIFCLETMADYIIEQLTQVRRTSVRVSRVDAPPVSAVEPPEASSVVVASERLDALLAAVYELPRSEAQALIAQGRVFINSRLAESPSRETPAGALVSVRGYGRFLYEGIERTTRRERLRVAVRVY